MSFLYRFETQQILHTPTMIFEVCGTMLIYVKGKICPFGLAVARAEEHLEMFRNKHLNSNSKDIMATGIYLPVLLQPLDVQTLLCHSNLPSQGESVQSETF